MPPLFIFLLTCLLCLSPARHFNLSLWKNYHLNHPTLILSHSTLPYTIELPSRKTDTLKESKYYYTQEALLMEFKVQDKALQVLSLGEVIVIRGLQANEQVKINQNMHDNEQYYIVPVQNNKQGRVSFFQKAEKGNEVVIGGDFDTLLIGQQDGISIQSLDSKFEQTRLESSKMVSSLLTKLAVPEKHFDFAQQMLSLSIASLCKEQQHIGLCDLAHFGTRHARYELDTRYSFLVLEILHKQFPNTALFLFENLINLFEDRLFYEEGHLPFVPIPEHLPIFRIFSAAAKRDGRSSEELKIRVKAVLNGLMNQMLLADVNSLQEEINYRETKNIHPTLYKMLTMKWKATSAKKAVSSIYEESFTPDYFYNFPNETIDTCVSKLAWIASAASEYSRLINEVGDTLDMSALQQPASLLKVTQQFLNSDGEAQHGRYYSINTIGGGVRVYAKQSGYESMLPFVYGLTDIFPEQQFKNITTRYGLASLPTDHPRANPHYEYRGNIHTYFNYKVLVWTKKHLKKPSLQYLKASEELLSKVRAFVEDQWGKGQSYTMWSAKGEGLRTKKHLSLLNVGLFSGSQ